MRSLSVSRAKRQFGQLIRGCPTNIKKTIPKKGSKSRILYELLMENKGKSVIIDPSLKRKGARSYLENFYGLNIVSKSFGGCKGCTVWMLAGEWIGPDYVDYT